jgi:hypothetical protein
VRGIGCRRRCLHSRRSKSACGLGCCIGAERYSHVRTQQNDLTIHDVDFEGFQFSVERIHGGLLSRFEYISEVTVSKSDRVSRRRADRRVAHPIKINPRRKRGFRQNNVASR